MSAQSTDAADLSSIRTQVDDIERRVTAMAERYGTSPDSQVSADLFSAERSLGAAKRALDRASRAMERE